MESDADQHLPLNESLPERWQCALDTLGGNKDSNGLCHLRLLGTGMSLLRTDECFTDDEIDKSAVRETEILSEHLRKGA